ncbi:MAG: hypothetical protein IJ634_06750 [Bacteroidales bacterium]|nr:hypothetical protein [Bacteroidales bacterium]
MSKDFDNTLEQLRRQRQESRCPMGDEELERKARQAWQADAPRAQGAVVFPVARRRSLYSWPAVAAGMALVLVPLGLRASSGNGLDTVTVDGQQVYFACNNACSSTGTIAMLDEYINLT